MLVPLAKTKNKIQKKEVIVAFNCGLNFVEGREANYRIVNIAHRPYLEPSRRRFKDVFLFGYRYRNLEECSRSPELFDALYRDRNVSYVKFCDEYLTSCNGAEIIIQSGGVDILPYQLLDQHFPSAKKALYFVDDPHATYAYGTPYSFAYEYAIYTSDAYSPHLRMRDFLARLGFRKNRIFKLPLCFSNVESCYVEYKSPEDLIGRDGCVYIGGYYSTKAKRIYDVRKALGGKNFKIYGNYPFLGYAALLRSLSGEFVFTGRVQPLSLSNREAIYTKSAVGFNLHQSYNPAIESGNARTYELPFRGVAQVLDRPPSIANSLPFDEGREVLYYDSITDAVDKIRWLLANPKERAQMAFNGYLRARSEYVWAKSVADLLDDIYRSE